MSISCKDARTIGVSALLVIIIVLGLSSYATLHKIVLDLQHVVMRSGEQLEIYTEINKNFVEANNIFYEFSRFGTGDIDTIKDLMQNMVVMCDELQICAGSDDERHNLELLKNNAKRIRMTSHAVATMLGDGRGGSTMREMEETFSDAVLQAIYLSSHVTQALQRDIRIETELLITRTKHSQIILIAVLFVGMGIAVWVTFFLRQILVFPIMNLIAATKRVAAGDLEGTLEIDTKDEIGDLARAFDVMRKQLRETTVSRDVLREAQGLANSIFQGTGDAVWVIDAEGFIMQANTQMLKLIGCDADDMIGKKCHELFPGDSCHTDACNLARIFANGDTIQKEENRRNQYGETVPVEIVVTPLRQNNEIIGIIEAYRDIRDRRVVEEALKQAKNMAESASQAKSRFLANMSHEIRTPMNAIVGFSDLLWHTDLQEMQKDYVRTIGESCKALLAIVNDILDISKIEADRISLEHIDFNLEYLMENVIKMMAAKVKGTEVELLYQFSDQSSWQFRGDPTRIRQILVNLIGNALKFTKKGQVVASVSLEPDGDDQKYGDSMTRTVRISIQDSGIGIPTDQCEGIFDAFTQADTATTRQYGGTGLGLAIVKKLVEHMSGQITVTSEKGVGSEFVFTLQLEKVSDRLAVKKLYRDINPVQRRQLAGKRIVIVDDNREAKYIAELYCKSFGMDVQHTSDSAREVLDWLTQQDVLPDVIMSDIMMPDMDGYEFARAVRADKKYRGVKLISTTSDARPGAARESELSGFNVFLAKPYMKGELARVIQVTLGDTREKGQIITRHFAEEISLKGVRVLLVEDNMVNLKLIATFLEMMNCTVDTADDGMQALEKLKNNTYDIILMDLQMPILGGCEATRIIRQEMHSDIPVIALTAAAMKEDQDSAFDAGMDDYLTKPVAVDELKEKITAWVNRSKR